LAYGIRYGLSRPHIYPERVPSLAISLSPTTKAEILQCQLVLSALRITTAQGALISVLATVKQELHGLMAQLHNPVLLSRPQRLLCAYKTTTLKALVIGV
jgi:hypothetical protein